MHETSRRRRIMIRSCLHCALDRALRHEERALAAARLEVVFRGTEATWLPVPGARLYRRLRVLLRSVVAQAEPGQLRLALHGVVPARSQVEVVLAYRSQRRWHTTSCVFPRFVESALAHGVVEGVFDHE
jgi:hypothetical protein